jgi:hypothetical protein
VVKVKILLVMALLVPLSLVVGVQPASAAELNVRITIERVREIRGFGLGDSPDFYAEVTIDGHRSDNKNTPEQDEQEGDDDITPDWQFTRAVDDSSATIPVRLSIFEEDGFLRGDDDHADLTPGGNRDLDFDLALATCDLTGEIDGACATSLVTVGDDDDDVAEVTFRVEVDDAVATPDLQVRCSHAPVWPQPGEPVTITVQALNGALLPTVADDIEIWVNDRTAPASTTNGTSAASFTTPAFTDTDTQFSYGCRVRDNGLSAFTGWRTVGVGPQSGSAAPVLITGPTASRIDVVFVAERDDYPDPTDPVFLTDVRDAIVDAYYVRSPSDPGRPANAPADFAIFLANQDKFNFWIANERGHADTSGDCDHDGPQIGFADSHALLHNNPFRDCQNPDLRTFSAEPDNPGVILHESGHGLFGLADEYCCDGGYFQTGTNPNIYRQHQNPPNTPPHLLCGEDAPALGRTAADCRNFTEQIDWWFDKDWSISEPATDDLMADIGKPQAADIRRIEAVFAACLNAGC